MNQTPYPETDPLDSLRQECSQCGQMVKPCEVDGPYAEYEHCGYIWTYTA